MQEARNRERERVEEKGECKDYMSNWLPLYFTASFGISKKRNCRFLLLFGGQQVTKRLL